MKTLLLFLISIGLVAAQKPPVITEPAARLATFDAVQNRLGAADLRLLDVRPKAEYDRMHITGALWIDAKAVEKLAAPPGALTDLAVWREWVAALGIGPETEVLIYDASRQLDAARLWWLLS